MNPKLRPNHQQYLRALRQMTSSQKFAKVVELSEARKRLFKQRLRRRFPELSDFEVHRLYLLRLVRRDKELLQRVKHMTDDGE